MAAAALRTAWASLRMLIRRVIITSLCNIDLIQHVAARLVQILPCPAQRSLCRAPTFHRSKTNPRLSPEVKEQRLCARCIGYHQFQNLCLLFVIDSLSWENVTDDAG